MFDDQYLASLPTDHYLAAQKVCNDFTRFDGNLQFFSEKRKHSDAYIYAYALINEIAGLLHISLPEIDLSGGSDENIRAISNWFASAVSVVDKYCAALRIKDTKSKLSVHFGSKFGYEFTEGDLKQVQGLINELRDLIDASTLFEESHKQRLLKRLETLQSELHKKVSDLDKFWGLVGEAGVVLGKFGKDAKPIVDRIREIAGIVWRTQAHTEELPSDTPIPLLTDKGDD